jgi:hypothetical protein
MENELIYASSGWGAVVRLRMFSATFHETSMQPVELHSGVCDAHAWSLYAQRNAVS